MNIAFLLTGSNLGNRKDTLGKAKEYIALQCGDILSISSLYETAAWGNTNQPPFYNQALKIETALTARQLMRRLLKIEKLMGRVRKEKYGPRIIDIDLLLFNNEVHNYQLLKLPHPEMQNRRFALMPMAEIEATIIHPVLKKTITQLLQECRDDLEVKKVAG